MNSDSHNPLPVSDDARARELEAENARMLEALRMLADAHRDIVTGYGLPDDISANALLRAREALEAGER